MAEDEQGALGREHVNLHPGHLCDRLSPDAGGVYHEAAVSLTLLARAVVAQLHAFHHAILDDEAHDLHVCADLGTMTLGVDDVCRGEAERVYRGIGHTHCPDERRVDCRFYAARLFRRDDVGLDAGLRASLDKRLLVVEAVLGKRDEETVCLLHAMASHSAKRHVFFYALACRLLVGITGATMQQTVVTTSRSVGEIVLLDKKDFHSAASAVTCCAGTGDATADNNHVVFFFDGLVNHCGFCIIGVTLLLRKQN